MKHILMVDDVATNLKCAGEVLKDKYELSMAKSGKQALKILEKERPDLILLDINMPDMDGYETMEKIKEIPDCAEIPIVFLTAESENESEVKGFKMGAIDFIRKPFEPSIMMTRIERVLELEEIKKELKINARKDVLTDLWNRQYLEESVNSESEEIDGAGAFMLIDMDNFKVINDNHGHITGDQVLEQFAEILKQYTSEVDVVSRLGGDEFAVFFKGKVDEKKLKKQINNIIQGIEKKVAPFNCGEHAISASAGVAFMPEDGMDFMTLYNKADKALYYVKQNGKGTFHMFKEKESYHYFDENEKEHSLLDMNQLKRIIEEKVHLSGAYQVEYDSFKRIYQFVFRCIERSDREVEVVLFTIVHSNVSDMNMQDLRDAMIQLETAIRTSLRKGDVATKYNNTQYIVILMDTNRKNGEMVADRIRENWRALGNKESFSLRYDIQGIIEEND